MSPIIRNERKEEFHFQATGSEAIFHVVKFSGRDAISECFQYDIDLVSEDAEVDLEELLKGTARLSLKRDEEWIHIDGILAACTQGAQQQHYVEYKATLVPKLWLLTLTTQSRIFQEQTLPEILEEVLKGHGLTSEDYDLSGLSGYPAKEFIMQWQESDFNFFSRLMEHEGIYYFFVDGKIVFADNQSIHESILPILNQDGSPKSEITYHPSTGSLDSGEEVLQSFVCQQRVIQKEIILQDYNWRKPSLNLQSQVSVVEHGHGWLMEYGNHYKGQAEGMALAQIRSEEVQCREKWFSGKSTCRAFSAGKKFKLSAHFRENLNNQEYLLVEVMHEGINPLAYIAEVPGEGSPKQSSYQNSYGVIPASLQFRPIRKAIKPKISGFMPAKIDAGGSGEYAEINGDGSYKCKLLVDLSDKKDGKASRDIRMAQPYAGGGMGMHFPLHKGTEVYLIFQGGDPDRPLIGGATTNPETASPVTGGNSTQCAIHTGGGNQIVIEDTDGNQSMTLSTPSGNTSISIGLG